MIKISVCMITYNHANYIKKAIESILDQKGNFEIELVIANDNSPDNSDEIINEIIKSHKKGKNIKYILNQKNIGIMPNFIQALKSCTGNYIALCEGDDYWTKDNKLSKQIDFLEKNEEYSICFHKVNIDEEGTIKPDNITKKVNKTTTIYDLAKTNYIHTCSVVYRNRLPLEFPEYFHKSPIGDYFLHMLFAKQGKIAFLDEYLANYRVHKTSYWSSKQQKEREKIWIDFLQNIAPYFELKVQNIFKKQIDKITVKKESLKNKLLKKLDLNKKEIIIFDDFIPSNLSPWRSYEYSEICKEFTYVKIYCDLSTYKNYSQGKTYDENLRKLILEYPSLNNKITKFKKYKKYNAKSAYLLFFNNLIKFYPTIKFQKMSFTFTLYPGGGFEFNNTEKDKFLKEVLENKLCKGVIVTQHATKKYLLEKNICDEKKITFIPGVSLNLENQNIENFEYNKSTNTTNILFFGNKYTTDGSDKGFDTFQKIVRHLRSNSKELQFTVIGGFNKTDIIYPEIKDIINFKGTLEEKEFTKILRQTHILISPNKPYKLSPGAFDGFPLSTCVSASLFGNVNMMTDHFNESDYIDLKDGIDFIKINDDIEHISKKILSLHYDKKLMKSIALNGRDKMLILYNHKNQILPRLNHLKKILF